MMQRRENELDALFKRKLEDLDMGRQDHLWQGIADQLSKNKRSNRMIGFAWFSGVLLSFTLLGLGISTVYRYNLEKESEKNQTLKSKTEVAHANGQLSGDNYAITSQTNLEQSSIEDLNSNNQAQEILNRKSQLSNSKVINNYNINIVANQSSKLILKNNQSKKNENTAWASNLNSKLNISESKNTNLSDKTKENSSAGTEYNLQENTSGLENRTTPSENFENKSSLDLNSNILLVQNEKVEELSFLNSIKNKEIQSKYIKSNSKRLKLPINDYCLAKNLTPLDHFDIDLYYSPEIATRTISAKTDKATPYAQKRAGSESFSGASSFGLRLSYVTKGGLAIRTGLNYSSVSEKFEYFDGKTTKTEIIYDQFNKPIDTIYTEVDKIGNQKNHYKFLDIPLMLGYEIDISDFIFSFNAGIGINLSTKYYGKIYDLEGMKPIGFNNFVSETGPINYFRSNVGTSLLASFGLNYKLNGRFLLLAEPNLRYYLNSLSTNDYPLEQRYLQLGIAVGLRYRFY